MTRYAGTLLAWADKSLMRFSQRETRLIGLSLLRIVMGVATILFYLSDYGNREFFWGPDSYDSHAVASSPGILPRGLFSLFFFSNSQLWFELVFNVGLLVAVAFTIFGGRSMTLVHAVFLWSIYNRNQDILEGGDNLARILIIFMVLTVTNAYFAPGAKERRARLENRTQPSAAALLHNVGVFLVLFQIAVLYFYAGYYKISGAVWQQGVAMYYISRINAFHMFGIYSTLMSNAYIGTFVCYFTIAIELGMPFAMLSSRAWVRKAETVFLEGMHVGIMVCMGLVCFGLIMIAADCMVLRDDDYRTMRYWVEDRVPRLRRASDPVLLVAEEPAVAVN